MDLSEKNFHLLWRNFSDDNWRENASVPIIRKIFFKKEVILEIQVILHSASSGHKITGNVSIVRELITCLHNIFSSDLNDAVKALAFKKFFQAYTKSCNMDETCTILQFFIVICHLLGLEQKVRCRQTNQPEDPLEPVINSRYFQEAFGVSCGESNEASYIIVNSLIEDLSNVSPDLNLNLGDLTYLQWFQSFVLIPLSSDKLSGVHLNFFCACSDLNTFIMERNLSKILNNLLSLSLKTFKNEGFVKSFNNFMEYTLQMYSKLQRLQLFIEKLLLCIRNTKSHLTLKNLLSNNFINEFSNMITLLQSVQSLSFMDSLLKALDDHCVKALEENSGSDKTLLVQVICALLSAFLRGVRVLSHTTPLGIMKSFLEKVRHLKEILGRFGKALLVRIHVREIVQPFLNLCYYWGEFELLVAYYAPEFAEQCLNKDISPTDLSALHSYLNGEEWNVLAERVSNFGAVQCYQSFLKLILQKLRTLQLKKPQTSISGEGTSKYVLTLLTCELYKHDIIEELTPEDVASLLSYLTQRQSLLLLDKMFVQVLESENGYKLIDWLTDSVLLEDRNFVVLSLVTILSKFGTNLSNFIKEKDNRGDPFAALSLDFVDESLNVNRDEVAKLVEKVNELLKDDRFKLDKDANVDKFRILLDVAKRLPLVNLSADISSLVLTSLTFLAVIFSNFDDFLKPMLHFMYLLSMKTGKKDEFSNFHIGLAINWLLHLDPKLGEMRNNLMKILLKKGISTEKGRDELGQLVRRLRKRKFEEDSKSLEHQIALFQGLGKSWVKTRNGHLENEKIMKYRNKLSKRIRKTLEHHNGLDAPAVDPEVLVTAFSIELIRTIKMKKEEDIVQLFHLNFDKFFDISLSKVKAGGVAGDGYHTFLTNILIHLPTLRKHLNKNALKKIWNALKTHPNVDWKLFCRIADDEEFKFFLNDLLRMWKIFQKGKLKRMNLEVYFNIWKEFYSDLKATKKTLYESYLKYLFIQFCAGMTAIDEFSPREIVQLFDFVRFCISTAELAMTSPMIDTSFDMMYDYEYKSDMPMGEFQKVFESCVSAASWLLSTRKVRTKDKIHNIFQLFKKLLKRLTARSRMISNANEEELLALSSCAHNLEKWTSKMVNLSKDFSRVSVYFIDALVSSFVKAGIYPVVKASLENCIYKFLSISDPHNIAHLSMILNPGSKQVFNGLYKTYKRYYKFTGKV